MIIFHQATINTRPALISLLAENNMDYVDPPEAYTLALDKEAIAGCGRLEDHGNVMLLSPLVVARPYRRRGIGRLIMNNILPINKPTVLVARRESIAFYKSMGFSYTDWDNIPASQRGDCETCPDRVGCKPQPMIFSPGSTS